MDDLSAFLKTLKTGALPGFGVYEWRIRSERLKWSDGMLDIYGLSEPPHAEEGFTDLVHPDDRVRVEATILAVMETGGSYSHEFRIVRPDGSTRVVHDLGVVERDAAGRAVGANGVNIDVTTNRHSALDGAMEPGVAGYDYDIRAGTSSWTPEAFRLFTLAPSDFIRPHEITGERVHEDDAARVMEAVERASRQVGGYSISFRIRRDDGAVRRILDAGETFGPIDPSTGLARRARGTLTDVTGIDAALDDRSAAARETFRQLVERSPFGIYAVDSDLRIAHASDGARTAFAGVDELIGRDLGEALRVLWPEAFATEAVARFRQTLVTGEPYAAPPLIERRADIGKVEAYDWKLERVTLPDGRPGVVCNFYDLSEREAEAASLRETAERLELAYEAGGMGAWDLDLHTDEAVWNPQMYRLMGVEDDTSPSSALYFERVHPEDRAGVLAAFEEAIRTGGDFDAEFRVVRPDGGFLRLGGRGRVVASDARGPVRMTGVNYDVTERRHAERRLRESELRLRLVMHNSVAFMAVLDPDGTMREVNARALEAGGLSREEVLGRRFHETPWWSHDPAQAERVAAAIGEAREGLTARNDVVVRMRGDTRRTVDMMLAPILDAEGRTTLIVASGVDVTEREATSEHSRMLMREINHRSKNLLTLVQIIARRTRAGDPEDFHERFSSRLVALAGAQDLLVRDDWDGAVLEDLVRSQLGHFSDLIGTRILLEGPEIRLDPFAAQHIGMVFHELATNAGKHGALSVVEGTVSLGWSLVGDGDDARRLALEWVEAGGPPVAPPTRTGFGSIVVDRMIRDALSADVTMEYGPQGFAWRAVCTTGFTPG